MPRVTIDTHRIREIYDKLAPSYDWHTALLEQLLLRRYRIRLLAGVRGRVLEVGVGTGRNFPYYPEGCQITAVDLSPEMLKLAEQHAARLSLEVTLLMMDAQELTFPDDSFDIVVSSMTLCTILDPIKALSEMARVTVPNGRILLLEHGRSTYRWLSWLLDRLAPYQIHRCGCHPNRNIVALAQAADLVVLRVERHLAGIIQLIYARPPRSTKVFK
jgi:ubiquinone/menaquinone biosynthesis C-methylase UbiE